jgi:hypothetical protein
LPALWLHQPQKEFKVTPLQGVYVWIEEQVVVPFQMVADMVEEFVCDMDRAVFMERKLLV